MTVKAIKGLGRAYEAFKKAGVIGDKAKMGEFKKKGFDKIINQKGPTPSKAESVPTKKSMEFEKNSSGVVTPKPSGRKTETEAYLKKLKINKFSKIDEAFKGMRDHFKKVEKSPEMKAYRKQKNWPKTKYTKEEWSIKKYREELKNKKNQE